MHKGSRDRRQFSLSRANSVALCVVGVALGVILYSLGLKQKWDAATVGTIAPFWYVASVFRTRWASLSFWAVISLCLVVHLGATWAVFKILLGSVDRIGLLAWIPVMMIEGFCLYVVVDAADRKLRPENP